MEFITYVINNYNLLDTYLLDSFIVFCLSVILIGAFIDNLNTKFILLIVLGILLSVFTILIGALLLMGIFIREGL